MVALLIGQGSPMPRHKAVVGLIAAGALALGAPWACGAPIEVRLRFVWGSSAQTPQQWFGSIAAPNAVLSELQPLGFEPDEAAAVRLVDNAVAASPLTARAFDGCDVTFRGDDAAMVHVALRNASSIEAKEIQIPLGQLAAQPFRAPLDELGGYLLVQRTPGDKLRVHLERDHLVLAPGEALKFSVDADLKTEAALSSLTVEARLRRVGEDNVLGESAVPFDSTASERIAFAFTAPTIEGAYRVTLTARRPVSRLAGKLVPWEQNEPVASRDVEFVVIDPAERATQLTDRVDEDEVQAIDPANSRWWQRVPGWTQLDRLPVLTASQSLGNVKPALRRLPAGSFVELPARSADAEPAWQAYGLTIAAIGEPHAIEIVLPAGVRQEIVFSIIEPDAAGRVQSFGRDTNLYCDNEKVSHSATDVESEKHRLVFWPRTASPILLIANHSTTRTAAYGGIRVLRCLMEQRAGADPSTAAPQNSNIETRLAAVYIGSPRLADCLGAAEELDSASNLSVDGWRTFLDAARRLAHQVHAAGYNAAAVSVAADGSSLAVLDGFGWSPRYDTGLLSARGGDVVRKDVLEALLRVFDRQRLRLIPVIELATPLPGLEALRDNAIGNQAGLECVAFDGRTWAEHFPGEAGGAHYNVLDPRVQAAIGALVDQFSRRYGQHPALAGLGVRLSGRGYGVLPGLRWCLDDQTTRRFANEMQVALPETGPDRFRQREAVLAGSEIGRWRAWRQAQVTQFYGSLAARLRRDRPDLRLVLCTEELFSGTEVNHRLRQALSGRASIHDAAAELGLDLNGLAALPGICLLRPRRLASDDSLQARAIDLYVNSAADVDQALVGQPQAGELFYHPTRRLRLASFDAVSPFGADKTYLSISAPAYAVGAAAQRPLTTALAGRDFHVLVEGGELLPLVHDAAAMHARRVFQELPLQLPAGDAEVRTERRQPATLRVYRTPSATTVCLINESSWPLAIETPIESAEPSAWRDLGIDSRARAAANAPSAASAATGVWPQGAQTWRITLPPYGMVARQYATRSLRVGAPKPTGPGQARSELDSRIGEIERRMASLDIERSYPQLQNPSFELLGAEGLMLGWQPRMGQTGRVAVDQTSAHSGNRALHFQSQDQLGVAAQSHLFRIPDTGRLVVRAQVRVTHMAPASRLYAWIEFDAGGGAMHQKPGQLGDGRLGDDWTQCEYFFDDLPLASAGQMRVQFHLAGPGEAWIDSVELFDLYFPNTQRVDLMRRLLQAKTAWESDELVDCQRLVDGYLPRFVVEYVPPGLPADSDSAAGIKVAANPEETTTPGGSPSEEASRETNGLKDRVRKLVPRIIR
jgi:hypothetical protein